MDESKDKQVSERALGRLFQAVKEEKNSEPAAARVEFERSGEAGKEMRLPVPGVYRLGRRVGCEIRFSPISDLLVSALHAELHLDHDGGELRDLGSKNGTYVNNSRISCAAKLRDGDVIELGPGGPRLRYHAPFAELEPTPGGDTWPSPVAVSFASGRKRRLMLAAVCLALAGAAFALALLM